MRARASLLVLAPHEPKLDPRIDWIATYASDAYDVRVLGLKSAGRPEPAEERVHGYLVRRFELETTDRKAFLRRVFPVLFPGRVQRGLVWVAAALFVALVVAPVFAFRKLWRALRGVAVRVTYRVERRLGRSVVPRSWLGRIRAARERKRQARPLSRRLIFRWLVMHFLEIANTLCRALDSEESVDLVHANDFQTLLVGAVAKAERGVPVVYDAHEFFPHADPESRFWERWIWRWYEKRLLRYVDRAFSVNPMLAAEMARAYGRSFGSLPNCEPAPSPRTEPDASRADARETVRFLYQGTFAPQRGLEELLRAWVDVDPRARLVLRGPDNDDKSRAIELARELDLLDRTVEFPPAVREDELIEAASAADVGVIPYLPNCLNYRFACPNKLSQYMQGGLAILTSDLDFVRSVVETYRCGDSYAASEPASVVRAVNRFVSDPEHLRSCRENALQGARTSYHWEAQSEPLYAAYAELLAARKEPVVAIGDSKTP